MSKYFEEIEFSLKSIQSVAERRKTRTFLTKIEFLLYILHSIRDKYTVTHELSNSDYTELANICNDGLFLADSFVARTETEIREVLYPLPEIKYGTHQFGTVFFTDYFAWKDPNIEYSPESLMIILESDLSLLNQARESLRKIQATLRNHFEERML